MFSFFFLPTDYEMVKSWGTLRHASTVFCDTFAPEKSFVLAIATYVMGPTSGNRALRVKVLAVASPIDRNDFILTQIFHAQSHKRQHIFDYRET